MGDASKLWSEGPLICNVDPKVMPHFSFHAKCNYCGEVVPFTSELEREMRKHYNMKHRLYCNACKKSDFSTREELETHLSTFHKDGICFNCHASFKMASAVAMHVEGPRNDCAVPQAALVIALRYVYDQRIHEVPVMTNTNTVYAPISCCSNGENTVQKLKEFKKTLLLAHEKAFNDMQQESSSSSEFPQLSGNQGTVDSQQHNLSCNADVSSQANVASSSKSMGAGADSQAGCDSPQVISKTIISDDRDIAALEMAASLHLPVDELPWTCSTCVDAKFTTLSKLIQHVEQKVRNSWWMSLYS